MNALHILGQRCPQRQRLCLGCLKAALKACDRGCSHTHTHTHNTHTRENDNGYMVCAICFEDSTERMLHVHIHILYISDEGVHRRLTTCHRACVRVDVVRQVLQARKQSSTNPSQFAMFMSASASINRRDTSTRWRGEGCV